MPYKVTLNRAKAFRTADYVVAPSGKVAIKKHSKKSSHAPALKHPATGKQKAKIPESLIPEGQVKGGLSNSLCDPGEGPALHIHQGESHWEGHPYNLPADNVEESPEAYKPAILEPASGKRSQGTTSDQYMEEWLRDKCALYLQTIISEEGRGSSFCEGCRTAIAEWRCLECRGCHRFCTGCTRTSHRNLPLHRIERWNGTHWRPAWLWQTGVSVCLGHSGGACPSSGASLESLESRCILVNETDHLEGDNTFGAKPNGAAIGYGDVVCFGHTNGFHYLPVYPCVCPDADPEDIQFVRQGFYPASWKKISTVFTFELLKDFHLAKVQSHQSTGDFCEVLCRLTNPIFPKKAPNRKRELSRVWAQYNYLTELKRSGFGHSPTGIAPGPGELAVFCPACPQPGINLPADWEKDEHWWLYRRYLVVDGNFVLDHLKSGGSGGIDLMRGAAFMTESTRYQEHLATAGEEKDGKSDCKEHRAVAEKNKLKKGYDATGLVAVACARHGCFAPCSVVDMQKGERHLNVDYSVCQSITSTKAAETPGLILAYDVNCQYCVNFRRRILQGSPFLSCPPDLHIDFVIGLFHVHGHKEACLARFAPTYLPGSGVTSGEILESLWATTNGVARISRNMKSRNRSELVDACMIDSNREKLLGLVRWLIRQRALARKEYQDALAAFRVLDRSAAPKRRRKWLKVMERANRKRKGKNESMDVYNATVAPVEAKKTVQWRLMNEEKSSSQQLGVASWVGLGIDIQENQMQLHTLSRIARKTPTDSNRVREARKSQHILRMLTTLFEEAEDLFPTLDLTSIGAMIWDKDGQDPCVCEEDPCGCPSSGPEPPNPISGHPPMQDEHTAVPIPSTLNVLPPGWKQVAKAEEDLRVAQANEALEALRGLIAHKSYLYREKRTLANGKRGATKGYDKINATEAKMRFHVKRYQSARWALQRLGVVANYPRLKPLTRDHTKAVVAIFDPNKRLQRNVGLSWIWNMDVEGDSKRNDYMAELHRVNWIRALSRKDRWKEEVRLVESEMGWYLAFLRHRQNKALDWARNPISEGHASYALRQADMWRRLRDEANAKFYPTLPGPVSVPATTSPSTRPSAPVNPTPASPDAEAMDIDPTNDDAMDVDDSEGGDTPGDNVEDDDGFEDVDHEEGSVGGYGTDSEDVGPDYGEWDDE